MFTSTHTLQKSGREYTKILTMIVSGGWEFQIAFFLVNIVYNIYNER